MKVVFMGSPEFAVPSLEALVNSDIEVLALITQPDKAVGRKQIITAPPTKVFAEKHFIRVFQPEKLNEDRDLINWLKAAKPDFIVTVAYGQIIKSEILAIAPVINVHASLLPDFRGPAPINWSIIHGDKIMSVTTMLSDSGVDTGDMLLKSSMTIDENERADILTKKLSELGADLLIKTLKEFNSIEAEKQINSDQESRQLAPFMDKKLGEINFSDKDLVLGSANPRQTDFQVIKINSASNIHNLVRATYPWPGVSFIYDGSKIIITETRLEPITDGTSIAKPGEIVSIDVKTGTVSVMTQAGILILITVKPEGKIEMRASDWANGKRLEIGFNL